MTVVEAFEQVRKWSLRNTAARFSVKLTRDIQIDGPNLSKTFSNPERKCSLAVSKTFPKEKCLCQDSPVFATIFTEEYITGICAFVPFNGLRRKSPNCGFPSHAQSEFHDISTTERVSAPSWKGYQRKKSIYKDLGDIDGIIGKRGTRSTVYEPRYMRVLILAMVSE